MAQRRAATEEELLRVLRLKSGRYTAERPIQLGALLAGAPAETLAELSRYGAAVGEAFQLQDDLLGLFGDPGTVGKPVDTDLKEGKFTFLIHHALARATPGAAPRPRGRSRPPGRHRGADGGGPADARGDRRPRRRHRDDGERLREAQERARRRRRTCGPTAASSWPG